MSWIKRNLHQGIDCHESQDEREDEDGLHGEDLKKGFFKFFTSQVEWLASSVFLFPIMYPFISNFSQSDAGEIKI